MTTNADIPTSELEDIDENLALQVRIAQLHPIYDQNINAWVGQSLSAIITAILIWAVVPSSRLLLWLVVVIIVQSLRYYHSLQYKNTPQPLNAEQTTFWLKAHVFFTSLTGLTWSVGAILLWPDSSFHQAMIQVVIMFTACATMVGHSVNRLSYLIYTIIAIVPVSVRFLMVGTREHTLFGIAILIGTAMLLRIAERNNKASVQALWIGIKYRDQANILAIEKAKTESLNQQLLQQTQALQESETRFRALAQSTFEGIIIHDKGQILDVNQTALELVGYERSEIIDQNIQKFLPPESAEIVAKHMRENYTLPYEINGMRKDGSKFPLEILAKHIPYNNGEARVVAFRDLTVRKELNDKAIALKLEQERVHLLSSFFQNASHEFRTPLSIISTATYFIGRSDDIEKQQKKLEDINRQVERINQLVNALQFMVKLDTESELHLRQIDINSTIKTVKTLLKSEIDNKKQEIQLNLNVDLPAIPADDALLHEALIEILKNASRYSDETGVITIKTDCDTDYVTIEISDNGVGIAEDQLNRIFERFYRVDEAHSTAGFGIGLPIAKAIIELHQGEITVQSEHGKGSTFVIQLPLASQVVVT